MADTIISVEQLGKAYQITHQVGRSRYKSLGETMTLKARDVLNFWRSRNGNNGTGKATREEFWALKDVSFEVKRGEVLGIIGRNGAGKSTLLKILSRITEPSRGRVRIWGRVASLLEVGTGFHPELTGRENIYLNGAILGMTKVEIRRKFDEIVDFSEVEKFLDTPVKHFSSGMYVRLAFAVAAHLEPEILIVDEVLAVGDGKFQTKCIGKMHDVSKGGRTVLFVSHQLSAVQKLCNRGLLLQSGRVVSTSDVATVLERYLVDSSADEGGRREVEVEEGNCRFLSWSIDAAGKLHRHTCFSRDSIQIRIRLDAKRNVPTAQIGVVVRNLMGDLLISTNSRDSLVGPLDIEMGETEILLTLRMPLKEGRYQVEFALADVTGALLDHWIAQPLLTVMSRHETVLPPEWQGIVNEAATFEVIR